MRRIQVFDTTLRDGEQSLNRTFTLAQKIEISRALIAAGVDVIEGGFPCSSAGDFAAVQALSRDVRGAVLAGLTRAVRSDIDACAEALREAECPRIHTGIAVSDLHMSRKLRKTPEQVIEMAADAVRYARNQVAEVEFYAEDATGSNPQFLARVCEAVIAAGATVLNIPDTTGRATPWMYESLLRQLREQVRGIEKVCLSVHCHNDLGMATANTLAGVLAGAAQVEVTVNGIGERAGNTALEEVVVALGLHDKTFQATTGIRLDRLAELSSLVADATQVPVYPFKAVVGSNAFSHASGIHQDGVLKAPETYEIIDPVTVGRAREQLVLTARSGRHALKVKAAALGWTLEGSNLDAAYARFLTVADAEQAVDDTRLSRLLSERFPQ